MRKFVRKIGVVEKREAFLPSCWKVTFIFWSLSVLFIIGISYIVECLAGILNSRTALIGLGYEVTSHLYLLMSVFEAFLKVIINL